MNWIDLTLGAVMLVSIVSGLRGGFARTAIGFAASLLGLALGLHYYHTVSMSLRHYISQNTAANLAGFLIVFCFVSIAGSVAAGMLAKLFRELHLAWLDALLGGAFGVVRGVLYAAVILWGMMAFFPVQPKLMLAQSRLAPWVMQAARRVADASPDEVKQSFHQSYRELNKLLPEKIKDKMPPLPPGQI